MKFVLERWNPDEEYWEPRYTCEGPPDMENKVIEEFGRKFRLVKAKDNEEPRDTNLTN